MRSLPSASSVRRRARRGRAERFCEILRVLPGILRPPLHLPRVGTPFAVCLPRSGTCDSTQLTCECYRACVGTADAIAGLLGQAMGRREVESRARRQALAPWWRAGTSPSTGRGWFLVAHRELSRWAGRRSGFGGVDCALDATRAAPQAWRQAHGHQTAAGRRHRAVRGRRPRVSRRWAGSLLAGSPFPRTSQTARVCSLLLKERRDAMTAPATLAERRAALKRLLTSGESIGALRSRCWRASEGPACSESIALQRLIPPAIEWEWTRSPGHGTHVCVLRTALAGAADAPATTCPVVRATGVTAEQTWSVSPYRRGARLSAQRQVAKRPPAAPAARRLPHHFG